MQSVSLYLSLSNLSLCLLGHTISPGLTFTLPQQGEDNYDEVTPWVELLEKGQEGQDCRLHMCPLQNSGQTRKLAFGSRSRIGIHSPQRLVRMGPL